MLASPAKRSAPCTSGYSYGGYASRDGVTGIAASVAARDVPTVTSGHAAAWVGVGGIHQGPGGSNAWLQTGLAAFPGRGLHLYVEEVSPGHAREFFDVGRASVARSYRVAVEQTAPDVWAATVDGRPVGKPAYLPTGGGAWRGVATAESWSAGRAACNSFSYRFRDVSVTTGSEWRPLADGQLVGRGVARAGSGFSARS